MSKSSAPPERHCNPATGNVFYGKHGFKVLGLKPVDNNKDETLGKWLRPKARLHLKGVRTFVQENTSDTGVQKTPRTETKQD
jgi:hypothetical protein